MRHSCFSFAVVLIALLCSALTSAAVNLAPLRILPVQDNGRSKPIDTFAIETVRAVTGYTNFGPVQDGNDGQKITGAMDPLAVILDWSTRARIWEHRPVLYVPLLELRVKLGMKETSKWISPRTLRTVRTNLAIKQWTAYLLARQDQAAKDGEEDNFTRLEQAYLELSQRLKTFDEIASPGMTPEIALVPDPHSADHWFNISELSSPTLSLTNADARQIPAAWQAVGDAYLADDNIRFASAAENLRTLVRKVDGFDAAQENRIAREVTYNRIQPFRIVWIVYAISMIALIASNMTARPIVYRSAMVIFCVAIAAHVSSFILRCSITGWAPVTNMYETVIWVSMMAALVSLVLELISRRRTAAMAGGIVALLVAIVADAMPPEYGSTIRNLTPVLRSNYWLVIHVLTIVSSYAAFALAMVLGDFVLFQMARSSSSFRCSTIEEGLPTKGHEETRRTKDRSPIRDPSCPFVGNFSFEQTANIELKRKQDAESIRTNLAFVYRSVQVGVLLVAAGTILGGLWADVSWGRFWGWDPKEVWALIVLLTYLALLHGRFAGWIGQFGLAAGAVICFTTVLMSWYGVNFVLGTGLHSYGFGTGGQGYVLCFVAAQWMYVGLIWYLRRRSVKKSKSQVVDQGSAPSFGLVQNAD